MTRLDPQRTRVQDDLRGLVDGEVHCDDVFVHLYSADSSTVEVRPLGVVSPRSSADVAACVRYAREHGLAIHCRGAGTGRAAGAIGSGIVLDLSRHMRRILTVDERSVRVQAGTVVERLNAFLAASQGRTFRAAPGNALTTTVGAAVAVDGAGRFGLCEGTPFGHVLELQVVLPDGQLIEVRRTADDREAGAEAATEAVRGALAAGAALAASVSQPLAAIAAAHRLPAPEAGPAMRGCGYRLTESLDGDATVDLLRLLAGSEGTLGIITELRVATRPLPRQEGAVLFFFDRIEKSLAAVSEILRHAPTSCDLVDRRRLSLIRDDRPRLAGLAPATAEAVIVVEMEDDDSRRLLHRIEALIATLCDRERLARGHRHVLGGAGLQEFRQWLRDAELSLSRVRGPIRPVPLADDVGVDPDVLPDCLHDIRAIVKRHRTACSIAGRVGLGQLRIDPLIDFAEPDATGRMRLLAEELHGAIVGRGGRFGQRSGCGLIRAPFFARWFPDHHNACRQVKTLLDPHGVLSPGKIVHHPQEAAMAKWRAVYTQVAASARGASTVPAEPTEDAGPPHEASGALDAVSASRRLLEVQLNWDPDRLAATALACDGCGNCRARGVDERMCPMFRLLPIEEASPRSKANLLAGLLSGRLPLESLTSEDMRDVVDLCVQCHLCRNECPCQIDIPRLVARLKAAHVAAHGLPLGDRVMARIDQLLGLAKVAVWPVNWMVGDRRMRWLMEKLLGIAQGRKLPRMHNLSYLSRVVGRSLTQPSRRGELKVALFVDTYSNYFDIRLIEQIVAVLRHNGVQVYVPQRQKSSGTQAIVLGDLDRATRLARHNVALLADAVRQGYHVVTVEPSSAVGLRFEYPTLLDDEDAELVAAETSEVCSYLWRLHRQGKLRLDFRPLSLNVGYHEPCRMMALRQGSPGQQLMQLIPGLSVQRIEAGCCGMAGPFGFRKPYYRASLRAGRVLMREMRSPLLHLGATECPACKIQMEQGAPKRTVHPIRLLAIAYGLAHEDGRLFKASRNRLIVS